MNTEIIETVLNEVLEEQRQSNQSAKDLQRLVIALQLQVADLGEKVKTFEQRLTDQTVIAPPADTGPVQLVVAAGLESSRKEIQQGMNRIGAFVEAQPKAVVRQFRVQFFPETDRIGNYKFFISRTYLVIVMLCLLKGILLLVGQYMDRTPPPPGPQESHSVSHLPAFHAPLEPTRPSHGKKKKTIPDTALSSPPGPSDALTPPDSSSP